MNAVQVGIGNAGGESGARKERREGGAWWE